MWIALMPFMEERFWLGWGYEAFWHEANFAVRVIEAKLRFRPYYAHNGIVETWLSLGLLGVATFVLLFVSFGRRVVSALYADRITPITLAGFAFLALFFIQNVSESTILMRNSMSWVLFIVLYLALVPQQVAADTQPDAGDAQTQPTGFGRRARRSTLKVE
jgi:exopolysaccharide production protein ExoQ